MRRCAASFGPFRPSADGRAPRLGPSDFDEPGPTIDGHNLAVVQAWAASVPVSVIAPAAS